LAFKGTDDPDYVVGQTWGKVGANRFLLGQVRDFATTLKAFREFSVKWVHAVAKLAEDKATGPVVISVLQNEI
jgi:phage terminase large subunit-like protein